MSTFDWFISDTHFGHRNILTYCNRPFASVQEMNDQLITNFRCQVSSRDNVLWLGDCFFTDRDTSKTILAQLPGRHFLVLGNHDKTSSAMTEIGFVAAVPSLTMSIDGRIVRAVHNPEHVDSHYGSGRKNEFVMHGHTHSKSRRTDNRLHVGVDAWDYGPVSIEQIRELVAEL